MRYRTFVSLWIGVAAMMLVAVCGNAQNAKASKLAQARSHTQAFSPDSTFTCTYTFTTGSGATYLSYCISVNGTFEDFQTPAGVEMLAPDGINDGYEGYGICDATEDVAYYDYNYADSGNWGSPTTVTNTSSEVKIERTTSDGLWTLTQTISREAGPPPYAKVVMALKNNSGITKVAYLERFAEMVPDNANSSDIFNENYDGTLDSAWGYNSYSDALSNGAAVYGMMLQNVEVPTPSSDVFFWEGFAQDTLFGPPPCDPTEYYDGTQTYVVGSAVLWYGFELAKEKTVTATMKYSGF